MKNGINIAGISELAQESRERPIEAQIVYRGAAHWDARGLFHARVGTITAGTCRAARDFRMSCMPGPRTARAAPTLEVLTPMEMATIGFGACLLVTLVIGSSSKGHTLMDVSVLLAPTEPGAAWGVEYDLIVRGDMTPEQLLETVQSASLHSPNHRTFVEPNTVAWTLSSPPSHIARSNDIVTATRDVAVAREDWPFSSDRTRVAARRHTGVRWDYGTQLSAWADSEAARHTRFPVDQTKQIGGMDRGPNPQEYLMCGLAASVVETATALARTRGLDVQEVTCRSQCRLDIRGFMGIDPRVPDKVQDISCALSFRGDVSPEQQAALAKEAVETSEVARLLTQPRQALIMMPRDGGQVHEILSKAS